LAARAAVAVMARTANALRSTNVPLSSIRRICDCPPLRSSPVWVSFRLAVFCLCRPVRLSR
jgi:hypothetical protein